MQTLFEFQVNRIKIEDFRNSAHVDILVYVDLLAHGDLKKNNRWLNSMTRNVNPFEISHQSDEKRILENLAQIGILAYVDLLAYVYFKINRWLNLVT